MRADDTAGKQQGGPFKMGQNPLDVVADSAWFDSIQDYLSRGRLFQSLDDTNLAERWVEAYKTMTRSARKGHVPRNEGIAVDDLSAELDLRGLPIPLERVREEHDWHVSLLKRDLDDPVGREKIFGWMMRDLKALLTPPRN
jgi:hypothetical protein